MKKYTALTLLVGLAFGLSMIAADPVSKEQLEKDKAGYIRNIKIAGILGTLGMGLITWAGAKFKAYKPEDREKMKWSLAPAVASFFYIGHALNKMTAAEQSVALSKEERLKKNSRAQLKAGLAMMPAMLGAAVGVISLMFAADGALSPKGLAAGVLLTPLCLIATGYGLSKGLDLQDELKEIEKETTESKVS